jgi:hypothetical protein
MGVHVFPAPVRIRSLFSVAAISLSGKLPAICRTTSTASRLVHRPCLPPSPFGTRNSECRPPAQWITRTISRFSSSTFATISWIRIRTIRCFKRISVVGEFHMAGKSCAKLCSSCLSGAGLAAGPRSNWRRRSSTSAASSVPRSSVLRVLRQPDDCRDRRPRTAGLQDEPRKGLVQAPTPLPSCVRSFAPGLVQQLGWRLRSRYQQWP